MVVARTIALCMSAAIVYGVLHDQVTARVCPEYFTIGHPPLVATQSPTLLGLAWGVAATWWVGLILGLALAASARAGRWPKHEASLVRPVLTVMVCSALAAVAFGCIGYGLASRGTVFLVGPLADRVPAERHVAFLADLWAHNASYASAFLGGVAVCYFVLRSRAKQAFQQKHPPHSKTR